MNIFSVIKKMNYKLSAFLKIFWWKLEYGSRLVLKKHILLRKRININLSDDASVSIGEGTFFNNDCSINAHGKIIIGDDCLFGEGVKIYDHNLIFNTSEKINKQSFNVGSVEIGDNCWICSNAVLLKGTKIGNNCVISAGCIINREIPANSLVRNISSQQVIERIVIK